MHCTVRKDSSSVGPRPTRGECDAMLKEHHADEYTAQVDAAFAEYDRDGSGELEFGEFVEMVCDSPEVGLVFLIILGRCGAVKP